MRISDSLELEKTPTHPQVEFGLDEDFDIQKVKDFLFRAKNRGGYNFQEVALRTHPQLSEALVLTSQERDNNIQNYVHGYYQKHQEKLSEAVSKTQKGWENYAPAFFQKTDQLFPNLTWPEGDYRGLLSISPPYPRYLVRKLFQFPPGPEDSAIHVTAHEMMHFLFFEYVRQRYTPKLPNTEEGEMTQLLQGKFQVPLWDLSEVFNTMILTVENFGQGGRENPKPYPDLVDALKTVQDLWQKTNGSINDFFTEIEIR